MLLITVDVEKDLISELSNLKDKKLSAFLVKLESMMTYELDYTEDEGALFVAKTLAAIQRYRFKNG
jgi:hypothetical protein